MSTISTEERREVARRLREVNPYRNRSYTVPYHRYIPAAEYLAELAGALGYSPKNDVSRLEFQSHLADLIDPTCLACPDVEDTPDGGQFECWSCSVCGNIVSVDPDYDTETDGPAYCEACGHRIIGKGEPTWL